MVCWLTQTLKCHLVFLFRAFSHSRSCTQSVFNRYCNDTIPVPTETRFNPFCTDPGNMTTIAFQASKKSKNTTKAASRPRQPTRSGARRNIRVLSRVLTMAVGVVNLTNVVRSLTVWIKPRDWLLETGIRIKDNWLYHFLCELLLWFNYSPKIKERKTIISRLYFMKWYQLKLNLIKPIAS